MDKLFNEDDLADLLSELNSSNDATLMEDSSEVEASQRRYMEIMKKHKEE